MTLRWYIRMRKDTGKKGVVEAGEKELQRDDMALTLFPYSLPTFFLPPFGLPYYKI